MGKSKGKERNSSEYYKSIIRNLKKENKQLRSELHKNQNNIDSSDSDGTILEIEEPKFQTCSHCGKGILNEIVVANRLIYKCTICDYRSRATKIDKDKP